MSLLASLLDSGSNRDSDSFWLRFKLELEPKPKRLDGFVGWFRSLRGKFTSSTGIAKTLDGKPAS